MSSKKFVQKCRKNDLLFSLHFPIHTKVVCHCFLTCNCQSWRKSMGNDSGCFSPPHLSVIFVRQKLHITTWVILHQVSKSAMCENLVSPTWLEYALNEPLKYPKMVWFFFLKKQRAHSFLSFIGWLSLPCYSFSRLIKIVDQPICSRMAEKGLIFKQCLVWTEYPCPVSMGLDKLN